MGNANTQIEVKYPRQESNLVHDLRGVGCFPVHLEDIDFQLGNDSAGVQGFEPCLAALETVCSPRSTLL